MPDIELVIKISEEDFERCKKKFQMRIDIMGDAIAKGTPLPKGHGRLKDFDKIEWYGCDFEGKACEKANGDCSVCNFGNCYAKQVRELPIIIEADKAESEDKVK